MKLPPNLIIETVSGYYKPELEKLYTRSRLSDVRRVRQVSMFFMREFCKSGLTPLSWSRIGDYFNRDHATAIHSYKVVTNDFETNPYFRGEINEIRAMLLKYEYNNRKVPVHYALMQKFGKQLIPLIK